MTFLPSLSVISVFTLASIMLAITPGPDMTLFLGRTLMGGRRLGFAAMLGASTGLLVHATLAGFGLSALIAASPAAFTVLKIIGAAYLLFLAAQAIRHGSALNVSGSAAVAGIWNTYLTGLGINLSNPKVIMFYITFLPQFVGADDPGASGKLLFLGFYFLLIGVPVAALIIVVAGRFINVMRSNPKAMRIFDYGFAALMCGFAARLLTTQGR